MSIDLEIGINKKLVQDIFNRVMVKISRKAKLLSLEGKSYDHLEYSLSEIPRILKNDMFSSMFINQLLNESDDNVVKFLFYVMDVYYNLSDDSIENGNVVKFLQDDRFFKYRAKIF